MWVLCRVLEECGLWRALPLCQHVDGQNVVPGRFCHHGHICKLTVKPWRCQKRLIGQTSGGTCFSDGVHFVLQTLSVSMLLRYSHHQIFVFIGRFPETKLRTGTEGYD